MPKLTHENLDSLYRLQDAILDPRRSDAEVRSLSRMQMPLILLRIEGRELDRAVRDGVRSVTKPCLCGGCESL